MSKDVVKNIGLGQVVNALLGSNHNGGGKFAPRQTCEESLGRQVARHRATLPLGQWMQATIDFRQRRNSVAAKIDQRRAVQICFTSVVLQENHLAVKHGRPGFLIFRAVSIVFLLYIAVRDVAVTRRAKVVGVGLRGVRLRVVNHCVVQTARELFSVM